MRGRGAGYTQILINGDTVTWLSLLDWYRTGFDGASLETVTHGPASDYLRNCVTSQASIFSARSDISWVHSFGAAGKLTSKLEFLSDNGGAYRTHETHALARALGPEPLHTPVCSPQSSGMAESFVNTVKRDYVSAMERSNAQAVLVQLPDAFTHFNEIHPHSSLKWKSPRMFRRELARRTQESGANQAIGCVRLYGARSLEQSL